MARKKLTGRVISNKMVKTVVVAVTRTQRHPLYEKVLRKTKKYQALSEDKVTEGARVIIEQTRPLSKRKRWRVVKVLEEKR